MCSEGQGQFLWLSWRPGRLFQWEVLPVTAACPETASLTPRDWENGASHPETRSVQDFISEAEGPGDVFKGFIIRICPYAAVGAGDTGYGEALASVCGGSWSQQGSPYAPGTGRARDSLLPVALHLAREVESLWRNRAGTGAAPAPTGGPAPKHWCASAFPAGEEHSHGRRPPRSRARLLWGSGPPRHAAEGSPGRGHPTMVLPLATSIHVKLT